MDKTKSDIIENFELFKETGNVREFSSWQFLELERLKLITITDERKRELADECIKPFKELLHEQKEKATSLEERQAVNEHVVYFRKSGGYKNYCRIHALKQYFQDLIDTEQHIKELL